MACASHAIKRIKFSFIDRKTASFLLGLPEWQESVFLVFVSPGSVILSWIDLDRKSDQV
jgi:hypothetical protein